MWWAGWRRQIGGRGFHQDLARRAQLYEMPGHVDRFAKFHQPRRHLREQPAPDLLIGKGVDAEAAELGHGRREAAGDGAGRQPPGDKLEVDGAWRHCDVHGPSMSKDRRQANRGLTAPVVPARRRR